MGRDGVGYCGRLRMSSNGICAIGSSLCSAFHRAAISWLVLPMLAPTAAPSFLHGSIYAKGNFCHILLYGGIWYTKGEAMANQEQLEILKQGVEVWNKWREENPDVEIDLTRADLTGTFLMGANFRRADLSGADLALADLVGAFLSGVVLNGANLRGADLGAAGLGGADLGGADLRGASLGGADLGGADLGGADLGGADLGGADLGGTDLGGVNLGGANLNGAVLSKTRFSSSHLSGTIFAGLDLAEAIGLEEVEHRGPSIIGTNTLVLSKGKIPDVFLRGCGLSDWEIEMAKLYNPDLSNDVRNQILYKIYDLQASQAVQVSPLFISYSHADGKFVDKIGDCLTEKGIRYWRDIHDMKAGRIEKQIDRAIRHNPTVLLILSEKAIKSDWVEHEVRTARELEKELGRDTLCPVALDDSWKDSPWPKRVMEQVMEYNILDFSEWRDDVKFEGMFRRLIDGLELFYKG
jgi:uncharacterized protein YjbI with pentapeptide repeats